MSKGILKAGLLTLLLLMLAPGLTHAQSQCVTYWCTASAYYDGYSVSGYVYYFDFDIGLYMHATAHVYTADNYDIPIDDEYGWDTVTATVDNFGANPNGDYWVFGQVSYENFWGWNLDGTPADDVEVIYMPTGETNGPYGQSDLGDGEKFISYLQPSYYDFDGFTMGEDFPGVPNDTCYASYRSDDSAPQTKYPPDAESGMVSEDTYTDKVWATTDWVNYYKTRVPAGNSCSESQDEFVYYAYEGNSYEVISIGVNVLPNDYSTFRGGCTVSSGGGGC